YDRLLVEAKRCDLESEDEIRSVVRQIDEYLTIETRRSALQRAVAGLRQCRQSLEGFADRFLQTPSKRVNRRDTLLTLRSLIRDFEAFLDALESKSTRSDEMELSGVGVVSLLQIRRFLEGARDRGRLLGGEVDDDHTVLVRIINEAQRNRDKNRYLKQIADLETVTRRLIQDFR
ncbi:MAG TPA: hypothetical protein VFQ39_17860, partial [Longimicrobium sp.]|nr:hypothetical protein [Longimicrobium sp.]